MKIKIAWIGKTKEPAIQSLTDEYLKRISHYAAVEALPLRDEEQLLSLAGSPAHKKISASTSRSSSKDRHKLVLLDSQGKQLSSEDLAQFLERERLNAVPLLFAVGGSDGFSEAARHLATSTISLGKMTFPHQLARVVLLEQLYRAFTILSKHPYHLGH